jgi:hypothetical protein
MVLSTPATVTSISLLAKNENDIAKAFVLPLPVWLVDDAAVLVAMITL